jgi:hypothetical protein
VRCYRPSPESGVEPEDGESEENIEEVANSEATKAKKKMTPKISRLLLSNIESMLLKN